MSVKTALQQRLIDDMIKEVRKQDEFVALVLDSHTSKIVSSCARMFEIMEAGVLVLQNIHVGRERLEDMAAVYFLQPDETSVNALIGDFRNKAKPQYGSAHIYWTRAVPQNIMIMISGAKTLVKRVKSFVELNCDFIATESRTFSFARTGSVIPSLYLRPQQQLLQSELERTVNEVISVCLTLNEYPYFRYSAEAGKPQLCRALAQMLERHMRSTIDKLPDWKFRDERATLLIVDRSIDPVAPLMHEYTYQAMVQDLMPVKGELCVMPAEDAKAEHNLPKEEQEAKKAERTFVLSEDDDMWAEFRHSHIGEVMQEVNKRFRDFKGANKMAQLQAGGAKGDASVKEMVKAMKDMPKYKAMMKKYHKHMALAQECYGRYERKKLKNLGELEQDIATGMRDDGTAVDTKKLKNSLVDMCQDPAIGTLEKLRLLMIYIISQGAIQESTRKELMGSISPQLQEAVRNLEGLGVDLAKPSKQGATMDKARKAELAKRNQDIPMALMRYLPVLHTIMQDLVSGTLDEGKFPFEGTPPPKGKADPNAKAKKKGRWRKGRNKEEEKDEDDGKARAIVFVLGGVTFSEVRSTYEIAKAKDAQLIIGSTSTMVAKDYIRGLSGLNAADFKRCIRGGGLNDGAEEEDDGEADLAGVDDSLMSS